ncbi:HAD family hydrolase [soil metagenome]
MIFDLDGTLVDTVQTRIDAWLATFAEIGIPAEREHVARLIGADGKRLARAVSEVAGRRIDDGRAEAIDKRAGAVYDGLNTNPRPLPGARQLLADLGGSSLTWAIATSSRREQVGASIAALRLALPPRIVDGSHVEHAKPAPDLLLLAADALGTAPGRCWYVGDATWDMLAAKAAGMVPVGAAYGAVPADALVRSGAQAVTTLRALRIELQRRELLGDG